AVPQRSGAGPGGPAGCGPIGGPPILYVPSDRGTIPTRPVPRQAPPAAWAQGPAPRVPVVRGQSADPAETAPARSAVTAASVYTPPPVPVSIPSPRAFGVADVSEQPVDGAATGTDWTTV